MATAKTSTRRPTKATIHVADVGGRLHVTPRALTPAQRDALRAYLGTYYRQYTGSYWSLPATPTMRERLCRWAESCGARVAWDG